MNRCPGAVDHAPGQAVVAAAVERFCRQGFQGTSIREIAGDAGLSTAALYEHFPSKQAILLEIIDGAYRRALALTEGAVAAAGDDPEARLEAAVWAQCDFSVRYRKSLAMAELEWLNLGVDHQVRILGRRRRLEEILCEIVEDGVASGAFELDEPRATGHALATLCASVASWNLPGVPRQIADTYCELAARMMRSRERGSSRRRRLAAVPVRRSA